jgi:hypothetical protein
MHIRIWYKMGTLKLQVRTESNLPAGIFGGHGRFFNSRASYTEKGRTGSDGRRESDDKNKSNDLHNIDNCMKCSSARLFVFGQIGFYETTTKNQIVARFVYNVHRNVGRVRVADVAITLRDKTWTRNV